MDDLDLAAIRVPTEAAMLPLKGNAFSVLLILLKRANKSMQCWIGRDYLLRYLPHLNPRNLFRAMRQLERVGVVKTDPIIDERTGAQKKNRYTITIPSLKKIRAMRRRETHARGCVKSGTPPASKVVKPSVPYGVQHLKPRDLEDKSARARSSDRGKVKTGNLENAEAAWALAQRFAERYRKKTGEEMVLFPVHAVIMDRCVSAVGEPAAQAMVDAWFESGPWSAWAADPKVRWKMRGGFERSIESIQDSERYRALKRRYSQDWVA